MQNTLYTQPDSPANTTNSSPTTNKLCSVCGRHAPRGVGSNICHECAVCAKCGDKKGPFKKKHSQMLCLECWLGEGMAEASIPEIFRVATHKSLNEHQVTVFKQYIDNPKDNLLITGQSGCGKTWAAAAILRNRIEAGHACQFQSMPWMFAWFRDNLRESFSITKYVCDLVNNAEYLLLDDLGANRATDWTIETLYLILDRWLSKGKNGIIITSNLTMKQIAETFSDRIASRLASGCRVEHLKGEDRRIVR